MLASCAKTDLISSGVFMFVDHFSFSISYRKGKKGKREKGEKCGDVSSRWLIGLASQLGSPAIAAFPQFSRKKGNQGSDAEHRTQFLTKNKEHIWFGHHRISFSADLCVYLHCNLLKCHGIWQKYSK